jgi:hypothetical protein
MEYRSKDKDIYKNNMIISNSDVKHVCTVELLYGTQGKRERKRE